MSMFMLMFLCRTLAFALVAENLHTTNSCEMRHPHGVLTLLLGIVLFVKHPEAFLGPAVLPSCSSR